jgi:4-hydroxy-3-methylbut-2-enyl diphosphate reductase
MKNKNQKEIFLINPRGFCSGVKRAIKTVNKALKIYSSPIYVFHDIVHNELVVNDFKKKGVIFKNNLKLIPEKSVLILSAHGVSPKIRKEAEAKKIIIIDATCPLVNKIHNEAIKYKQQNYRIILIGKKGHHEVTGIMGEAPMSLISRPDNINRLNFKINDKIACLTQTTFLKSDRDEIFKLLKSKYKNIIMPSADDICPATYRRREAISNLNKKLNLLLVIGSEKSNNARRLFDIAMQSGIKAHLLSSYKKINAAILKNCKNIGITAAASTPEEEVSAIIARVKNLYAEIKIREIGVKKTEPIFSLPL